MKYVSGNRQQATGNKTEQHGSIDLMQKISAQNLKKRIFSEKYLI
jgi:hypothetical protein